MSPSDATVLFVDSDPGEAALVAEYLQRPGSGVDCSVTTETYSEAALERLRTGEQFDCVVSDSRLPGTDGISFLEAVHEQRPEMPVLLFSSDDPKEVAVQVVGAGLTDFLAKGFDADQYTMLVRRVGHAIRDGIGTFDPDRDVELDRVCVIGRDERFESVDEGYTSLYGYTPAEVLGRHWSDLHPESEVEHIRENVFPVVLAGGQWVGRIEGLRADGSTFVESKLVQALDDGRLLVAVRAIDPETEGEPEAEGE